jgi:hypothetical protein
MFMLYGEELINPIEKYKLKAQKELLKRQKEIQLLIKNYLKSLMETGWTFETSAGADLSISTPVVKVGAIISAGAIYLKKQGNSEPTTFRFAGGGGTVGGQLIPVPWNFDLSLKEFYSSGRVLKTPFKEGELTENDFRGSCLFFQAGYQATVGWSESCMLMGGDFSALLLTPNRSMIDVIFQIVRTSKAIVPFHGMNVNLFPFGGGAGITICGVV